MKTFLAARGKLGELIAEFDWTDTPLGRIEGWPQYLRTVVALILRSPLPIVTLWGDDGIMIYNDAYSEFAGARHPDLLGSKVREGWSEVADFNDNVVKVCLAGGTLAYKDMELTLHRAGRDQQAWMNLDYSPVLDEAGNPVGVIAVVVETTEKVRAERWLEGERERLRQMFEQAPGFMAILTGPAHVFDLANPAYFDLVGQRDLIGKSVRDVFEDFEGQAFFEILDRVYASGEPFQANSFPVKLRQADNGEYLERFVDLVYQPLRSPDGKVMGVFVQGADVTRHVQSDLALSTNELRNRQILDSAIDYGIIALDLSGRVTQWNEGARRIFGWTEDEMFAQHIDRIFTPEDQAIKQPSKEIATAIALGVGVDERWHMRSSGERFWANGEMTPIRDAHGELSGLVKVLRDRTKEHLADEALKESERRLLRAQRAGGVGIFSLDLHSSTLTVTGEFCRIYGLAETAELQVEAIENLLHPDDREIPSRSDPKTANLNVEYRVRRADTAEIRVISRKAEFENDDMGAPIRLVGTVRDVTDERKVQRDLLETEARFRALTQAMPNQVWTALPDGQLDWFNERIYEFSGFREGELTGEGWAQMVHPDDLAETARRWAHSVATGATYETEFRLRAKNGRLRWHIGRAVPVRDDIGRIFRWIGTNTDVEDLRSAQERLARLNQSLSLEVAERTADRDRMWTLSTDVMLVVDFHATITAINPAWTHALGWPEHELIGRSFMDLVHPDDRQSTLDEVAKLGEGVTTFRFVNRYQCKDGSYRVLSWTAVPDESHIHAVGRDITAEREAAEALRKTELALQQAQKMEAIGNLTGGVAHDFNNLLQVVSGNLQMLSRDVEGNDRAEKKLQNALSGVNRGAKLAAQLLAFGRRQALDPRVLNVGRLVSGMDDMLRRTLGEGVEIETIVSGGLWNTLVDPAQIENALLNLAINARDAMDGYGKLTIEVGNAFIDDAYAANHSDVEPGQYVSLAVTDTGSGMTEAILQKVFEPFFTTKADGKGTGLGLSMVYGFVKQTGGHIKIYSEIGHGTTVRIYLPRSVQSEDLEVTAHVRDIEGGSETILVAEDDEGVRATVVEMLRELGYKVLRANDAASALSIIESGVHIDLLFTDVVMPGPLKSPELARKAKERMPHLAVLFTSGYTENSIVHGGRLDAGVQLLSKPYTREQLARKIRHQLANTAQREQRPNREADQSGPKSALPLKILFVEDDALIRITTGEMVGELGYDVTEAASAEEALDVLGSEKFDVLLTDLGLPRMSGLDLARRVRREHPDMFVIFASGENKMPDLEGERKGMLRKPYSPEEIDEILRKAASICLDR